MFAVQVVNSLPVPFVLPMEEFEVMKPQTLANTSWVSHQQHMHMAARHFKEPAEQRQQGTWRLIAPTSEPAKKLKVNLTLPLEVDQTTTIYS